MAQQTQPNENPQGGTEPGTAPIGQQGQPGEQGPAEPGQGQEGQPGQQGQPGQGQPGQGQPGQGQPGQGQPTDAALGTGFVPNSPEVTAQMMAGPEAAALAASALASGLGTPGQIPEGLPGQPGQPGQGQSPMANQIGASSPTAQGGETSKGGNLAKMTVSRRAHWNSSPPMAPQAIAALETREKDQMKPTPKTTAGMRGSRNFRQTCETPFAPTPSKKLQGRIVSG